ncbi:MAG: hypothetical protein AAFP69_17745, partial [Planctomycetota bacterium]
MIFFRRNETETDDGPQWDSVRSLLEDDGPRGMLRQLFPGQSPQSFLAALRQMDSSAAGAIELAGHQLQMSSVLAQYPTLAVAGMLNSGKTSLVATFLSENGRDRTLRGVGDAEGTHRFVLWLPQAWRADTSVWDLLMQRIGSAIGNSPEILSDDPLPKDSSLTMSGQSSNPNPIVSSAG